MQQTMDTERIERARLALIREISTPTQSQTLLGKYGHARFCEGVRFALAMITLSSTDLEEFTAAQLKTMEVLDAATQDIDRRLALAASSMGSVDIHVGDDLT